MAAVRTPESGEQAIYREVESLLDDPGFSGHPLREALERLLGLSKAQSERMERLVRISDGYHDLSRRHGETLVAQYDRQLKRLEKVLRISDRYQRELHETSKVYAEAALRDPLTGIGNRRYLMERLKEETVRAERLGTAYALLMIDADMFKGINDRYGHEAGDKALCAIAEALRGVLREYDVCGRWGGEEFLAVLPDTSQDLALEAAERVRKAVESLVVTLHEDRLPLSVSVGVSSYGAGESFEETLRRADDALYLAKDRGRNRVEVLTGETVVL